MKVPSRALAVLLTSVSLVLAGLVVTAPASAAPTTQGLNPANVAAVERAQAEYAQTATPADLANAKALYSQLVRQGLSGKAVQPSILVAQAKTYCVTVYKWQLLALGWAMVVLGGGGVILASIAADFTIVGLPAGLVLTALGITLGETAHAFIDGVNAQKWNSKTICVRF